MGRHDGDARDPAPPAQRVRRRRRWIAAVLVLWTSALVIPFAWVLLDGTASPHSRTARKQVGTWIAKVAGIDVPLPGSERVVAAASIAMLLLASAPIALAIFTRYRLRRSSAREKEVANVPPARRVVSRPALHPTPVTTSLPAASSPPGLALLCVAVPSERRAVLEERLRATPSVHTRLAETIHDEVTSREAAAWVWLERVAAPVDAPDPDAEVATRALDALVRRDAPSHDGGFRDPASLRSALGSGYVVLAIAVVARDVMLPSRDLDDRARVASAVAGLLPIAPEAVLHHAYRFIPDDSRRAFDDATLRATFPELRPL